MAIPARITLKPVVKGDTWDGMTVSMSSTETALDSDLATVRMQWQTSAGTVALTLSSEEAGEITITDAGGWEFTVEPRILSIDPSVYAIGVETTDAQGLVKTRIEGIHEILADPVA